MELITKYFPTLSEKQISQIKALPKLYRDWNKNINVISRKDTENIVLHHLLHSLSISFFVNFKRSSKILDLGTGGGLPGIPLAILFPEVNFTLVDGTSKKIKVADEIIKAIGLKNCKAFPIRAEQLDDHFDFVLARAVTRLNKLVQYSDELISKVHRNPIPNGLITLKGGDLKAELTEVNRYKECIEISTYYTEEYFKNKYIVYVPIV